MRRVLLVVQRPNCPAHSRLKEKSWLIPLDSLSRYNMKGKQATLTKSPRFEEFVDIPQVFPYQL
jgi:hypothetical protein